MSSSVGDFANLWMSKKKACEFMYTSEDLKGFHSYFFQRAGPDLLWLLYFMALRLLSLAQPSSLWLRLRHSKVQSAQNCDSALVIAEFPTPDRGDLFHYLAVTIAAVV